MKEGKVYKIVPQDSICKECGQQIPNTSITRFPFDEQLGMFCGEIKSGFLLFRFSGSREGCMNGGNYEEVKANITITEAKED
jgi:hypothetical protein